MRDCPTVDGSSIPLIVHRIGVADCQARQSCNYHKCHRCVFRGKAADWQPADTGGPLVSIDPGERPHARPVEVPRPGPVPAKPARTGSKRRKSTPSPA